MTRVTVGQSEKCFSNLRRYVSDVSVARSSDQAEILTNECSSFVLSSSSISVSRTRSSVISHGHGCLFVEKLSLTNIEDEIFTYLEIM